MKFVQVNDFLPNKVIDCLDPFPVFLIVGVNTYTCILTHIPDYFVAANDITGRDLWVHMLKCPFKKHLQRDCYLIKRL